MPNYDETAEVASLRSEDFINQAAYLIEPYWIWQRNCLLTDLSHTRKHLVWSFSSDQSGMWAQEFCCGFLDEKHVQEGAAAMQGSTWTGFCLVSVFQQLDWPDDHLMEPLSNEDTHLQSPVPEAPTHITLPLHCDDQHFSSPATPPPTYGEAGEKTKSIAALKQ